MDTRDGAAAVPAASAAPATAPTTRRAASARARQCTCLVARRSRKRGETSGGTKKRYKQPPPSRMVTLRSGGPLSRRSRASFAPPARHRVRSLCDAARSLAAVRRALESGASQPGASKHQPGGWRPKSQPPRRRRNAAESTSPPRGSPREDRVVQPSRKVQRGASGGWLLTVAQRKSKTIKLLPASDSYHRQRAIHTVNILVNTILREFYGGHVRARPHFPSKKPPQVVRAKPGIKRHHPIQSADYQSAHLDRPPMMGRNCCRAAIAVARLHVADSQPMVWKSGGNR